MKKFMQILKKTYYNRDSKAAQITLVWTCTENGRKQDSQKSIVYESGINKTKRQTKKQMAGGSEGGWKNGRRSGSKKCKTGRNGRGS